MKALSWLSAVMSDELLSSELEGIDRGSTDACELVEQLARGAARVSAWNAYVFRPTRTVWWWTESSGRVTAGTVQIIRELYALVPISLDQAREAATAPTPALPHWHTAVRTRDELVAMRETLDVRKTLLAHDLGTLSGEQETAAALHETLARIDTQFVDEGLWIRRPPPELRGKIGDLLASGLQAATTLGQLQARLGA